MEKYDREHPILTEFKDRRSDRAFASRGARGGSG